LDATGIQTGTIGGKVIRMSINPNNQTYAGVTMNYYFIVGRWNGSYIAINTTFTTDDCDYS
jgi:hypothetical protein